MKITLVAFVTFCSIFLCSLSAAEGQYHGVAFEKAVLAFHRPIPLGYSYTSEWDLPAPCNLDREGVPASIKCIEVGNAIYLGDAYRQRTVHEPFQLIVGFWEPDIPRKVAVMHSVHVLNIEPTQWHGLFGTITAEELKSLHEEIQHRPLAEARVLAKERAVALRAKSNGIKINPKLDKSQRRIQCSMDYEDFARIFLGGARPEAQRPVLLYGKPFPAELPLGSRVAP